LTPWASACPDAQGSTYNFFAGFRFISTNWQGEPLRDYETIVRLISNTKTAKGLIVNCTLDYRPYPIGIRISKKEMEELNLSRETFHGEWNYTISPRLPE
jgi:hypothetical protein